MFIRIAGSNRFETAFAAADMLIENLAPEGTVYLLGGVNAVPAQMEQGMDGLKVIRLGGANRYDTNLLILKEAGVEEGADILVCTGKSFADGLSASSVNKPILLVHDTLLDAQTEFLESAKAGKFYLIGGTNAVSAKMNETLASYAETERIGGATRYITSVNIAKTFFKDAENAVLAYGLQFPDGLSGGPLAYSMKAPVILAATESVTAAAEYMSAEKIVSGAVLGGEVRISDSAVKQIFGEHTEIIKK